MNSQKMLKLQKFPTFFIVKRIFWTSNTCKTKSVGMSQNLEINQNQIANFYCICKCLVTVPLFLQQREIINTKNATPCQNSRTILVPLHLKIKHKCQMKYFSTRFQFHRKPFYLYYWFYDWTFLVLLFAICIIRLFIRN